MFTFHFLVNRWTKGGILALDLANRPGIMDEIKIGLFILYSLTAGWLAVLMSVD